MEGARWGGGICQLQHVQNVVHLRQRELAFTDFKAPSGQRNKGLRWRGLDEYLLVAVIVSALSSLQRRGCQQRQGLDMTNAIIETIACDVR